MENLLRARPFGPVWQDQRVRRKRAPVPGKFLTLLLRVEGRVRGGATRLAGSPIDVRVVAAGEGQGLPSGILPIPGFSPRFSSFPARQSRAAVAQLV